MIIQILGMAKTGVIGCDGKLPWYLPADLTFFKNKTMGSAVIMGRKTWESLPFPLPGRHNIVVSASSEISELRLKSGVNSKEIKPGTKADFVRTIENAVKLGESSTGDVYIIGGSQIYERTLDICDMVYLTYIDENIYGDTYYPFAEMCDKFELVSEEEGVRDDKNTLKYYFRTYMKPKSGRSVNAGERS